VKVEADFFVRVRVFGLGGVTRTSRASGVAGSVVREQPKYGSSFTKYRVWIPRSSRSEAPFASLINCPHPRIRLANHCRNRMVSILFASLPGWMTEM
jgi:hypothetical protein